MTLKNLTPSPDLSGLSAAELLAVIAGFQQQLALKDEALQSKEEAIQRRDAHILLLEELLRLRRIQRFAASSEKLHQLQLFDEAELEADMDALLAQLPDDLPQTAEAKAKPRQRGFSASLLRERIELTLSDEQKAGASKVFFTKVKEAREQGDLSENAEYDAAKDEQRDIEARIEQIEKILKNAEVVVEDEVDLDKISVGCVVKVLDVEYDEEEEFKLVGSSEANSLNGKISNESPVGKALIGARVGDTIKVETQAGEIEYKVLEIQRSK